ncbi:MAG: 5-formyltetrahydrofolate cyclo-ligase [Candidatus Thermoplasmatota archaeon]
MEKRALRNEVQARLRALAPAQRALEEQLVGLAVQASPEWQTAGTLLLYRSHGVEFSTVGLANAAWREGKRTIFPVTTSEGIRLRQAASWTEFRAGANGILEPTGPAAEPSEVKLAIVPGVAFTRAGGRLGRGGGHYDRFLPSLACPIWGLAFDAQVVPALELEPHDRGVDRVWNTSAIE